MITASVGRGGVNRYFDTKSIQLLLNDCRKLERLPAILVDGIVGPQTIGAITEFQRRNGLPQDGRIDPHGPTLAKLDKICADLYASAAYYQFSTLMKEFNSKFRGQRTILAPQLQTVRTLVSGFRPAPLMPRYAVEDPSGGATSLLGFAQAIPIILVFLLLLLMLLVITSNPVWQRAAREFVEGLRERIRDMSEKVREAIDKASKAIEEALKGSPECARAGMICSDKLIPFRKLVIDILEELSKPKPDNFRLARLLEEFQKALEDLLNCLVENGCTVI